MNIEQARFNMVEQQIRTWEVLDQDVLDLLYVVRREEFVPPAYRGLAFSDMEIPLGHAQCMLAPRVEARMLQDAAVQKHEKVLEIGTGSGFMTALLAHRALAGYTLAMSHLFDLTGPAFAALRLPSILAAVALLIGPLLAYVLRRRREHLAATVTVAVTFVVFLVAAHIAFARFEPMLSSKQLADTILQKGTPADSLIVLGEQSEASSVIFYTHHFFNKPAFLAHPRCGQNGEGSTLLWGSCYPDAPDIFLSDQRLAESWGAGERKWLFAQDANRDKAEKLLAGHLFPVQTIADKTLWTDRPLADH